MTAGRHRPADERRARLARDVLEWLVVVGLLALLFRPLAWVVGLVWAIRLARRGVRELFAPELRERWVAREVERRMASPSPQRHRELHAVHDRRVRELSAALAAELREPVRSAKALVRRMEGDPGSADNVSYADAALAELDRVERSIAHLLERARRRAAPQRGAP